MKKLRPFLPCLVVIALLLVSVLPLSAQTVKSTKHPISKSNTVPKAQPKIRPVPPGPGPGPDPLPKGDLQVGVVKITPQNVAESQFVTFEGNIMNRGNGPITKPVGYLKIDAPPGITMQEYREEFDVTLNENQGVTFVQRFKVPKFGDYTCKFNVFTSVSEETDYNNNKKNLSFRAGGLPDLMVCVSNGKRPPVGGKRAIHAEVRNIGNVHSLNNISLKLRFYVEGKGAKMYDIPGLPMGDFYKVTRNHKWGTAGTKTISAKVIYERNEISKQNNEAQGSFFVRLPHHNKYSTAPPIKCSTNKTFNTWEQVEDYYKK